MPESWIAFFEVDPNRALAYLTLVLILVTAFYAAMTYRMAALMASDLRLRLRPFVRLNLNRLQEVGNNRHFSITVHATKNAAIVKEVSVVFLLTDVPPRTVVVNFSAQNTLIQEGSQSTFSESVVADRWPEFWLATVEISDALGKHSYQHIASHGEINYPLAHHITFWARFVAWLRTKRQANWSSSHR